MERTELFLPPAIWAAVRVLCLGPRAVNAYLSWPASKETRMLRVVLAVTMLAVALSHPATSTAQWLPPGGYYANGAYYVPSDLSASISAQGAANGLPACPPGYGVPTVYVASTATMMRIQQVWPVGGDAPGFPYVPVYGSAVRC
jgi:hypothetical protein